MICMQSIRILRRRVPLAFLGCRETRRNSSDHDITPPPHPPSWSREVDSYNSTTPATCNPRNSPNSVPYSAVIMETEIFGNVPATNDAVCCFVFWFCKVSDFCALSNRIDMFLQLTSSSSTAKLTNYMLVIDRRRMVSDQFWLTARLSALALVGGKLV